MRTRYKFLDIQNQIYFVTLSVVGKIPIFTNLKYSDIIIENFNYYRKTQGLKIFYYVIMDNHIHLIASHPDNISQVLKNFKSYTAKAIIDALKTDESEWILFLLKHFKKKHKQYSTYQLWEEGSHPQIIESIKVLRQKIDYIHNNPVKRGLVRKPEDWVYSSVGNIEELESVFKIDELE